MGKWVKQEVGQNHCEAGGETLSVPKLGIHFLCLLYFSTCTIILNLYIIILFTILFDFLIILGVI